MFISLFTQYTFTTFVMFILTSNTFDITPYKLYHDNVDYNPFALALKLSLTVLRILFLFFFLLEWKTIFNTFKFGLTEANPSFETKFSTKF